MYGKIFESIYDGSLYGDWEAIVVFKAMIVLADETGIIDMSPQAFCGRTSYPMEVVKKGLSVLQKPDPDSRHPAHDGRRIIPLENGRSFGWQIVNYQIYRDMATRDDKKKSDRERIARKRSDTNEAAPVAKCRKVSRKVADVAYTDTDTDTNTDENNKDKTPPVGAVHRQQAVSLGVPSDLWDEYIKTRKRVKATNSPLALTTLINLLSKYRAEGISPAELVAEANMRGWKSVFPPKPDNNHGKQTASQRAKAAATDTKW
jgi:hypothetical protein